VALRLTPQLMRAYCGVVRKLRPLLCAVCQRSGVKDSELEVPTVVP